MQCRNRADVRDMNQVVGKPVTIESSRRKVSPFWQESPKLFAEKENPRAFFETQHD